jgi:hypothetical protein
MHRTLVSGALVLALSVLGAGPASAGTWDPPEQITSTGFGGTAAIGSDGTAAVLWVPQHRGEFGGRG